MLRLFFVYLLAATGLLHAQAGTCTLNSAQTIGSAFVDLQGAQPVPEGALLGYCVRTNSLNVATATITFSTAGINYPFVLRVTDVGNQQVQMLMAPGDVATVEINRVYYLEFEALTEGTGEVSVSGGTFATTVVGEVERIPLPLTWAARPTWKREKRQLWLEWTVREEREVDYYAIEESVAANDWRERGRTPARGRQRYVSTLADDGRKRLLRIVGVDLDGHRTESPFLEIPETTGSNPLLVPNPATDRVRIIGLTTEEVVAVELFDALGRRYSTVEWDRSIELPRRGPTALYVRIITRDGKVFTRTVIRK